MHVWNFSITQLVKPSLILLRLSTDFAIAGLWITSNGFNQKCQLHNAHVWINKSWDVHQVLNITSASLQKKNKKKLLMTLLSRNLFIQLRIFKLANVASVYGTKNVPEKSQPTAVSEDLSFSPNIAGGSHQPLPLQGLKCKYFNLPQSHLLHLIWSLGFMWSIFCRQCYLLPSGPLHFISFNDRHYIPLREFECTTCVLLPVCSCVSFG